MMLVGTLVLSAGCAGPDVGGAPTAANEEVVSPVVDVEPAGGQPAVSSARCVAEYSPETLAQRRFAFDGTVRAIETGAPGRDAGAAPVTISYDVHHSRHPAARQR